MFMMALGRVAVVAAVLVVLVVTTQAAVPLSITQSQPPAAGALVQQQEDVVSLLGEVAGGRLAACHPIILTHNITASPRLHTILLGLQQSMTNAFLIYDVEPYLRSFPPGVPLFRRQPPESDGTYCVAYYVLAPLPLLAAALSAIPKTDWFPGATRYFVCCTGSSSSLAINTLEEEPSILASYNTLYVSHNPYHDPQDNRSWSLNLLSNCPFCRSGEPEVILRNKWSPWRGLQHHTDLFPDLFRDCNGHVFRAVTLSFPPLSHYLSGNSTHPLVMEDCLDKRLIDTVAQVHNFTYVVYEPADGMWGYQLDNGSFTGVLGDVQHYRKDFSFGVSLTAEREEVTDCTIGYISDPITFVTRKPKPLPQWLALVRPYQAYVWLSFLLMLAATGPTYWLLEKLSGSSQPLLEATFNLYGAMLTQGRRWPSSSAMRVYSASWLLFCLVVTVSYVGNLTAFLTVPALSPTVDSLEELIDSDFVWGINDIGAADYQLFKTSKVLPAPRSLLPRCRVTMFTLDQAKVVRLIPVKHPSRKERNLLVMRKFFDHFGITGVTGVVRSKSGSLIVTFAESSQTDGASPDTVISVKLSLVPYTKACQGQSCPYNKVLAQSVHGRCSQGGIIGWRRHERCIAQSGVKPASLHTSPANDVPLYQEIFRGLTFCPSLVECIQQTLDERFAFISFQIYLRDAIAMFFTDKNGDTQVYLAKQSFFPADVAFATQKGSPMKRVFDKVFKRLLGGGFTARWITTLIEEHTLATRRKATAAAALSGETEALLEGNQLSLTLHHLQGVFYIYALGLLLSALLFTCELILFGLYNDKKG
ncbi:Glutamate receptor ionotropic, delta-1-like 3 [Homarus americanus]|uniref:Glutamate receptor ionotropic, delta-1-like 3 n=1 Tax=Homarus americanus TaxID=6706 RepID=A0A8J5JW95_HOMAM|nr:Glutamate receptor ionotropic, delta-1-like 3 [Homarus americanus]